MPSNSKKKAKKKQNANHSTQDTRDRRYSRDEYDDPADERFREELNEGFLHFLAEQLHRAHAEPPMNDEHQYGNASDRRFWDDRSQENNRAPDSHSSNPASFKARLEKKLQSFYQLPRGRKLVYGGALLVVLRVILWKPWWFWSLYKWCSIAFTTFFLLLLLTPSSRAEPYN